MDGGMVDISGVRVLLIELFSIFVLYMKGCNILKALEVQKYVDWLK